MTPDEIRIAVAEIMWEHVGCPHWVNKEHKYSEATIKCMFNYPASLDACAEMAESLSPSEKCLYVFEMLNVLGIRDDQSPEPADLWDMINATPLQRCEAFLRVKGKWKEATP